MKRFLWLYIFVCFFYLIYRYPFQINSSLTSPSYIDTPFSLMVGKYIIVSVIFGLWFFLFLFSERNGNGFLLGKIKQINVGWLGGALISFFSIYVVWSLLLSLITKDTYFMESSFFWISAILTLFLQKDFDEEFVGKIGGFIKITAWLFLAGTLIQLILFISMNRLPALAYEGTLSIRFGSWLDDPNGYSFLLSLFFFMLFFLSHF